MNSISRNHKDSILAGFATDHARKRAADVHTTEPRWTMPEGLHCHPVQLADDGRQLVERESLSEGKTAMVNGGNWWTGEGSWRLIWSGRPGSNRRHSAWEADVLPLNYSRNLLWNQQITSALEVERSIKGHPREHPVRLITMAAAVAQHQHRHIKRYHVRAGLRLEVSIPTIRPMDGARQRYAGRG